VDLSYFLFILCDVKYHGNAKVSFTLYVLDSKTTWNNTEEAKKCQNHIACFFLNDPLFLDFIFLLFLVHFQLFEML